MLLAAFNGPAEADLVTRLRPLNGVISLVAAEDEGVVGHIMFSPVTLHNSEDHPHNAKLVGLAPVAVLPEYQKIGIGKALILDGLERCKSAGFVGCVLLGHPEYYPRFGFQPAFSTFEISSTYNVSDPVFMALELVPNALRQISGTIHYHPAFQGV